MLQIIIQKIVEYIRAKNRWWIPIITGLSFAIAQPPFNHEFHPLFVLFPFISFIILIPLFGFATTQSLKQAMVHAGLYGFFASISQYYWIGFVTAEWLWHLILIGVVLIAIYFGIFYFAAGMLFRFMFRKLPRLYLIVYPALWVGIDYVRTLGEISFPWEFLGYSLIPFTSLIQVASITGVWGLTFIIVLGNLFLWELLKSYKDNNTIVPKWIHVSVFCAVLLGIAIWGAFRISRPAQGNDFTVSLLQTNIDQLKWGNNSLDTAFRVTDSMVKRAAIDKPDLMVGPESALLCFLERRSEYRQQVKSWVDTTSIPLFLGGLHWDKAPEHSYYEYLIYNSAFLFHPDSSRPSRYHKIKLVPFSEALPFEGIFPILSRTNLGEADFQRGNEQTIFSIGNAVKAAPFICYEVIYPGFVQQRMKRGANLIMTVTNDGWFGKTSGPYHHAAMARMRAVENGKPMVRCANSGISLVVDKYGNVLNATKLYERTILTQTFKLDSVDTLYLKCGDWFVAACVIVILAGLAIIVLGRKNRSRGVVALPEVDSVESIRTERY